MREFFGVIFAVLAIITYAWVNQRIGKREGLKRGYDEGYKDGRQFEADWWIGVESEIDQARQKLWEKRTK